MADNCVFCRIVSAEAPASVVLDTADVIAFMDLRQHPRGHVVLIPKQHLRDINELDDATGAAMIAAIARISRAVTRALAPDGLNISSSNGKAAGQEVFHVHFHILPRWEGDGVLRVYAPTPETSRDELDSQAALIRSAVHRS
jgi:histidine triad (HIT) family protein